MTKGMFDPVFRAWRDEAERASQQTENQKIWQAFRNGFCLGAVVACAIALAIGF